VEEGRREVMASLLPESGGKVNKAGTGEIVSSGRTDKGGKLVSERTRVLRGAQHLFCRGETVVTLVGGP
jgi:hypothetical protein